MFNFSNKRSSHHRVIASEFVKPMSTKEELAQSIAAQRTRLVQERGWAKNSEEAQRRQLAQGVVEVQFPRSQLLQWVSREPQYAAAIGVGALVVLPLLMRKYGSQPVLGGVRTATPLLFNLLTAKNRRTRVAAAERFAAEMADDEE